MNLVLEGEQLRRVNALKKHYELAAYRDVSRKALDVLWEQTFGPPGNGWKLYRIVNKPKPSARPDARRPASAVVGS